MANPKVEAWREAKNCIRSDRGVISEMEVAGDALAADVARLEQQAKDDREGFNQALGGIHVANHEKRIATRLEHEQALGKARRDALREAADELDEEAKSAGSFDRMRTTYSGGVHSGLTSAAFALRKMAGPDQ